MSEVSTSRRDVMRALAIVPAVIAAPAVASTALAARNTTSLEWNQALARHSAARDAADRYCETVYRPAWETWRRAVENRQEDIERRIAAVPHYITKAQTGMPSNRFS